ncbi:histidine--tRNA ligase [bacterium]|nr:MAG: histidine--tRNA ligase [bacterium]
MAQNNFSTHHGMVDILPEEAAKWQYLESLIRDVARSFHFEEIRTPILEQTELIARGIGALTDIVSKEMFAFSRGEDNYVLRPEGTAPVARAYIQHSLQQRGGTQNLFYIGPMFRAERPQKGRQRQFHQFGAEVLGSADPLADAEIIAFMMEVYKRIGVKNMVLKLNSVGDPESRAAYKTALQDYFRPFLSQLSEISQARFDKNPMRILDSKEPEDQHIKANAPKITDYLNEDCSNHFEKVKSHLDRLGITYILDPFLVRGLDYYTKTAFELTSSDLGGQDALGGGGRYDLLIEELGGKATPAVGFASGMERLLIVCEELGIELAKPKSVDVYIVTRGEVAQAWAMENIRTIRETGLSATMDLSGKSMKAQMKDADRKGARFAIIVGEDELQQGLVNFRVMADSTEESISFTDALAKLNT